MSPLDPEEPAHTEAVRAFRSEAEAHQWGHAAFAAWAAALTGAGVRALARYQNSGHRRINAKLRRGLADLLTDREFETFVGVDRATRRGRIPEPLLAYRGIGPDGLLIEALTRQIETGARYRDAAFGSASLLRGVAQQFTGEAGLLVEILIPAGAAGVYLNASPAAKDKCRDQCELLLARDLLYNVVSVIHEGDASIVRMEICLEQE